MTFALPPLVFIVFASVFAAGASGKLDVKAGVFDQARSAQSRRFIAALTDPLGGRLSVYGSRAALMDALADGRVDAGLTLTGDLTADPAPITVLIQAGARRGRS
jgi:ABC-2 type transport system permease protein